MAKVTFRTNLGSVDAKRLNLDHRKCQVGETLDVDKGVAEELGKMGVAVTSDEAEDDDLIQSAQEQAALNDSLKEDFKNAASARATARGIAKEPTVKGVTEHDPKGGAK